MLLVSNLFPRSNWLCKCICVTAYQFCSCNKSRGRAIFACCRKLGYFSSTARRDSKTNIFNKRKTKFKPWKTCIKKEHQIEAFQLVKHITLWAQKHKRSGEKYVGEKRVKLKPATLLTSIAVILFQTGDT